MAPRSNNPSNFTLRLATKADLNEIADVAVAAFPDDPEFDYRFPYRAKFPDDHWKWTRREYQGYLAQPSKYAVLVVDTDVKTEYGTVSKPVALAVWDVAVTVQPTGDGIGWANSVIPLQDSGITERRDANPAHMREFARSMDEGFDCFFGGYGSKQFHLWLLATHPDHRRRGAGTMLCKWGIDRATSRDWVATVLGSPMGTPLYKNLGFRLLGCVVCQIEGEEDRLVTTCMIYKKRIAATRKSGFLRCVCQ